MKSFEQAVAEFNQRFKGFGGDHVVASPDDQAYQMAKALQYANESDISVLYAQGRGYVHQVLGEVAATSPDAASLFHTSILENPPCQPFVRSMEFLLAAIAERSPETWDHIRRHTALSMHSFETLNGPITLQNRADALNVMLGAMLHDAGKLGIDPDLLHKRTRLQPQRFEQLMAQFKVQVPDYAHKDHDIRFLEEAQNGKLIFADAPIESPSDDVIDWDAGQRRSEESFAGKDDQQKHNGIMARIIERADAAGLSGWMSPQEVYTLALSNRGTLSPHERVAMESHDPMSSLYLSLQDLPTELSDLPELVNMDTFRQGGVADSNKELVHLTDVFEALTAKRSYKDAFAVSEALKIMHDMAAKGQISQDLVQQFTDSDIWYDYAKHYDRELGDLSTIQELKSEAPGKPSWTQMVSNKAGQDVSINLNLG